jgi:hypothetical protein
MEFKGQNRNGAVLNAILGSRPFLCDFSGKHSENSLPLKIHVRAFDAKALRVYNNAS